MAGIGMRSCKHSVWKAGGRTLKVLGQLEPHREVQACRLRK